MRGTRFNTGDGIRMALDAGAAARGHWSGCHAVGWDANAPEFGDLAVGDGFQKHSYPFGIMVNARGQRFVDEGADFRNYTYAKYGREILAQPGQIAWQIFDAKVTSLLRDEYRIRQVITRYGRYHRCAVAEDRRDRRSRTVGNRSRVQCSRGRVDSVRPNAQRRSRHPRHTVAEIELGKSVGYAAIRSVRSDVWHHVHVRRPARRRGCARHLGRRRPHSRSVRRQANSSAVCSTSTIRAAPGSRRAPCSDGRPASAPQPRAKTKQAMRSPIRSLPFQSSEESLMERRTMLRSLLALAALPAGDEAHRAAETLTPPDFPPLSKTEQQWKELLAPARFQVLFEEATERPFSSPLNDEKHAGTFMCAACFLPLFDSKRQVRQRHGLAELHPIDRGPHRLEEGLQARVAAHRVSLRTLRGPSGPRLQRRSQAARRTMVQQRAGAVVHPKGRHPSRSQDLTVKLRA